MNKDIKSASDLLGASQNKLAATAAFIPAIRNISLPPSGNPLGRVSSQGSVNSLAGVLIPTLDSPVGIPLAATMRNTAAKTEAAAQAAIDQAIYTTYKDVFDAIVAQAQAGSYEFFIKLTEQQQTELTPLLTKSGYTISLLENDKRFNLKISWK